MVAVPKTPHHCIKTSGKQKLMAAETSDSTTFHTFHIRKGQHSDDKDSYEDSNKEDANGKSEQEGDGEEPKS